MVKKKEKVNEDFPKQNKLEVFFLETAVFQILVEDLKFRIK